MTSDHLASARSEEPDEDAELDDKEIKTCLFLSRALRFFVIRERNTRQQWCYKFNVTNDGLKIKVVY